MPKNSYEDIHSRIIALEKESSKLRNIISRDIKAISEKCGQVVVGRKSINQSKDSIEAELRNKYPRIYEAALIGEVEYMTMKVMFCRSIGSNYKM